MFEAVELGRKTNKKEYEAEIPGLRSDLLKAQATIRKANRPVIMVVSGVDGAGKVEIVHRLNEWLDPRGVDTLAFSTPSDEERERPPYWRYWRAFPARGRIGIFFGSWYTEPIVDRVFGRIKKADLDRAMQRVALLERMLVDDGAVIIKLWFHITRRTQRAKLRSMLERPDRHQRVLDTDRRYRQFYGKFVEFSERALRITDSAEAPWILIEAENRRYRELRAARALIRGVEVAVSRGREKSTEGSVEDACGVELDECEGISVLDSIDLKAHVVPEKYRRQLLRHQAEFSRLVWKASERKVSSVIVFEGWDAAGKGSGIRRVTQALDPRLYSLYQIAAPTDEERAHHYLWRFWRRLGRAGQVNIFDRSWYGRVLVERVEKLTPVWRWRRAFSEINDFEEQLMEHGILLIKFWIHISKREQLNRFRERQKIPYKRYKITEEDWRNRERWEEYEAAVNEMVARTSTGIAPWTLVAGNDKRHARIQILKTLCRTYRAAVGRFLKG